MVSVQKFTTDLKKEIKMKKIVIVIVTLNSIFLTFAIGQQQQFPNLWNVLVHASISYNKSEKMFYYEYSMANDAINIGSIDELQIDISRKSGTSDIDTVGLRFENDGYTEKNYRLDFPHLKGRIIPVGFLKTPVGKWTGDLSNALTASFFTSRSYSIHPGQTLDGFEMMSKGLPSIRRCIVTPFFDIIALFPDPADTTITYYVPPLDSVRNAVKFYGWSIGPTSPPIDFIATIWCDTLLSYTRQSAQLGWLIDKNVEKRINQKIELTKRLIQMAENCATNPKKTDLLDEAVKEIKDSEMMDKQEYGNEIIQGLSKPIIEENKELEQFEKELTKKKPDEAKCKELCGKTYTWLAIKTLESLVYEVEVLNRLSEKKTRQYLTSEAYALLKYNIEYLIGQLPEEKKK
jgi:hypothetical protein